METTHDGLDADRRRLFQTMEQVLATFAPDLRSAMQEATQLIAEAFGADKVDAMFLDRESNTLVALGTSDMLMGRRVPDERARAQGSGA